MCHLSIQVKGKNEDHGFLQEAPRRIGQQAKPAMVTPSDMQPKSDNGTNTQAEAPRRIGQQARPAMVTLSDMQPNLTQKF